MKKSKSKKSNKSTSKKIPKYGEPKLSEEVLEEFKSFVNNHSVERLSRNLRKMLIEFLTYQGATEAMYLQDLLFDLEGLYYLLDEIQDSQVSQIDNR